MIRLAAFCLALTLGSAAPAAPSGERSLQGAFKETVDEYRHALRSEGAVGSSVYLVHRGRVIAKDHFGHADLASKRAVDENTIYHWASITKTFTGIALMQLRDRGLVSLDDPVTKYIPELRAVHNTHGSMDSITLRQLMSHSAGFRRSTWPWGGDLEWHPHEPKNWQQLVAMMPYTEIEFAPGSKYSYSNLGLTLVGRVVEIVSGDDIEVYIDKNILKPLGMTRSYFDLTPWHLRKFRSNNYRVANGVAQARGPEFDTGVTVGNGGLNAPVSDMVRYVNFLTGSGDKGVYEEVLSRATLDEMWKPLFPAEAQEEPEITKSMGLAFFTFHVASGPGAPANYVNHSGSQLSYRSFIFLDPRSQSAAIMAANSSVATGSNTSAQKLRNAFFRKIFPVLK
jgi:CubicO group peptidase (beta-lactamase class C family)